MITSIVACGVAVGLVFGRRERGSNAVSPSVRYRASSSWIHDRDTA
jgi:hypothetical protein